MILFEDEENGEIIVIGYNEIPPEDVPKGVIKKDFDEYYRFYPKNCYLCAGELKRIMTKICELNSSIEGSE